MVNVFLIGSTGHIGGAVLDEISKKYRDVSLKALVRDSDKASRLVAKYPEIQTVIGDLSSLDLITEASREADIVINTAPDITHEDGIKAVISGIKDRSGPKGYYIHTSGAWLIVDPTEVGGVKDARLWDDVADIEEILSMPDSVTHSVTDKLVRSSWPAVNVAIIAPGGVGGMSPSVEHPTPITVPAIVMAAKAFDSGFVVEGGSNQLGFIDVIDLARMFIILFDDAITGLSGKPTSTAVPVWGPQAYYFGASENMVFADWMTRLVTCLHEQGTIKSPDIQSATLKEVARRCMGGSDYDPLSPAPPPDSWARHIAAGFGLNMRLRVSRMRTLGWEPKGGPVVNSFDQALPEYLRCLKAEDEKRA